MFSPRDASYNFLFFIAIACSNIESSPATFESYRARARSASSSRTSVSTISRPVRVVYVVLQLAGAALPGGWPAIACCRCSASIAMNLFDARFEAVRQLG